MGRRRGGGGGGGKEGIKEKEEGRNFVFFKAGPELFLNCREE